MTCSFSAVWKAVETGNGNDLQQLLQSGCSPSVVNCKHHRCRTTPLMAAAESRNGEGIVWQLVAAGADVNATDSTNLKNTALHYAAMSNDDSLTVSALLASGADAFATNRNGLLPLDLARQHRRKAIATTLMEHMKVHSGWLYTRSKLHWKKHWGVVIACNKQRTSTELCIFQHPRDIRPEAVLLVDESSRASSLVYKSRFFASKSKYALTFDKPVMWQCAKRQKLTRSPICRKTMSLENIQVRDLVFAADNPQDIGRWQRILQSSNFYDRETRAPFYNTTPHGAPRNELYYWPHELFHNEISRQHKMHEDSETLTEQSGESLSEALHSENEEFLADALRGLEGSNDSYVKKYVA